VNRPSEVPVRRTLSFLRAVLPPPPVRILEVGSGNGEVAAGLAAAGHSVVALDQDEEAITAVRALGVDAVHQDFLAYQAAPSDVVLFTRSLHHIHPLSQAVARATELVEPGGLFIADEFARDRVDAETAAWHFDSCALLADAGLLPPEPEGDGADPLRRWRDRFSASEHHHTGGEQHLITTGADMIAALHPAFALTRLDERVPYHYRYVADRLPDTPEGTRVALRMLATERRRIARSGGAWAGLRIVARRR
jgi:SAM-dependent methyltransferase